MDLKEKETLSIDFTEYGNIYKGDEKSFYHHLAAQKRLLEVKKFGAAGHYLKSDFFPSIQINPLSTIAFYKVPFFSIP